VGRAPISSLSLVGASSSIDPQPPFFDIKILDELQTSSRKVLKPDILPRIENGFFMEDNDWTCYQRDTSLLRCSYMLTPSMPKDPMHVYVTSHHFQVHNFAVAVSAVKDGRDGKPIELVQQNQHRPKSDRYENALRTNLALLPSPTGENSSLFGNISKSAPIQ